MSLETRSNSALMKRAEQLKRWQDSETFREPGEPKRKTRKVNFAQLFRKFFASHSPPPSPNLVVVPEIILRFENFF
jgi:hypothetical protein